MVLSAPNKRGNLHAEVKKCAEHGMGARSFHIKKAWCMPSFIRMALYMLAKLVGVSTSGCGSVVRHKKKSIGTSGSSHAWLFACYGIGQGRSPEPVSRLPCMRNAWKLWKIANARGEEEMGEG